MLRRAPIISPKSCEMLSVARVRVTDNGTIAIKFKIKMARVGTSVLDIRIATAEIPRENNVVKVKRVLVCSLNAGMRCRQSSWS
jgi:hypothetical protein